MRADSTPAAWNFSSCAVIVAHPDDETLWAGGTILLHPECDWTVLVLSRKSDCERSPRFFQALAELHADGAMGDLDDGPDQIPLPRDEVASAVLRLLPRKKYDLILTHSVRGEYTRHRRHEEVGSAVLWLWHTGEIAAAELWMFAFEDGRGSHLPRAILDGDVRVELPDRIWETKRALITKTYGFDEESWEAGVTPTVEAYWRITHPSEAEWERVKRRINRHESTGSV